MNDDLPLETVYLLDQVQKHKHIPDEAVAMLREQGLAEGREPDKRGEVLPLE